MISVIADPALISTEVKTKVRDWIIKMCKGEVATWPGYPCAIWLDDTPRYIKSGTWAIYNAEIYVGNDGYSSPPKEIPGVLLAISYYFGMKDDEELQNIIWDLLARVVTRTVKPFHKGLVYTLSGADLHKLGINPDTGYLAAQYTTDEGPVWKIGNGQQLSEDEVKALTTFEVAAPS